MYRSHLTDGQNSSDFWFVLCTTNSEKEIQNINECISMVCFLLFCFFLFILFRASFNFFILFSFISFSFPLRIPWNLCLKTETTIIWNCRKMHFVQRKQFHISFVHEEVGKKAKIKKKKTKMKQKKKKKHTELFRRFFHRYLQLLCNKTYSKSVEGRVFICHNKYKFAVVRTARENAQEILEREIKF